MTILLGQIVGSLLLAAGIGAVIGWLICQWTLGDHLQADLAEVRKALFIREAEINQLREVGVAANDPVRDGRLG